MITLLVAIDEKGVIGNGPHLPWHIPGDMKAFRERTMGGTLIMGRTTWRHLPVHAKGKAYLDGRVNMVLTRDPRKWAAEFPPVDPEGPHFADALELAISRAKREFPEYAQEMFIIGGREIYDLALRKNLVDRMIITRVAGKHEGDVYFPQIPGTWTETPLEVGDGYHVVELTKG